MTGAGTPEHPVTPEPHGSASIEPLPELPDPQDAERAATAQRNRDALSSLGRTVAGATRSAAEATGAAASEAAARTAEKAGQVREQVADRVAEASDRTAGPDPVGPGVVVAGPGLPTGTGSVTLTTPPQPPLVVDARASSVALTPPGSGVADIAGSARDRAAAAGSQAAGAGRRATEQGRQAASTAGDEVAARARQAGDAAQQAGVAAQDAAQAAGTEVSARARQAGDAAQQAAAAAQEAGAAALASTRTAVSGAVASGRSAVRERTAPPIDLEGLAAEVLALPGVAGLAPDAASRGRGLLPGQVAGAQVTEDEVSLRVVARYGVRLRELADQIHGLARPYADGRRTHVEIADLDPTGAPARPARPEKRNDT